MPETAASPLEEFSARLAAVERERDEFKRLYVAMLEAFKKLEAGLTRHSRERFDGSGQLALSLLSMMAPGQDAKPEQPQSEVAAHRRVKPSGRKPLPAELPRIDIEVTPPEVQRLGLDASSASASKSPRRWSAALHQWWWCARCGWHFAAAALFKRVVDAMWVDALSGMLLCMDATGVLVQQLEKCRKAHFFVVIAPQKHVLFGFTPKHDSAAVKQLIKDFKGHLVLDAHTVYDFLFVKGEVLECGCWAHARRYWFKTLDSDGPRARHALALIGKLFELERKHSTVPPAEKLRHRKEQAQPIVDAFFAWCEEEALKVIDETPASKAIRYALNQRVALSRFLTDGSVPLHNNWSENELRREALGRKNWLFLGSDKGGEVNATLVSLLASCKQHGIEPLGYFRDLLCLARLAREQSPRAGPRELERHARASRGAESAAWQRVPTGRARHARRHAELKFGECTRAIMHADERCSLNGYRRSPGDHDGSERVITMNRNR